MPNDALPGAAIFAAETERNNPAVSPDTGTPAAANDDNGPPAAPAVVRRTVSMLDVGTVDERGNTVKYIYARDPDYVVYYSRLERRPDAADYGWADGTHPQRRRWLPVGRRRTGVAGSSDYRSEGVQALLSNEQDIRRAQRKKLLPLGVERAKLQALLTDWPRRQGYDASIATALQVVLDGDGKDNDTSGEQALATLADARASLLGERDTVQRARYVTSLAASGILGFLTLVFLHWWAADQFDGKLLYHIWIGTEAGLVGAILSIAIGLRRRTIALDIGSAGIWSDCFLRLLIGVVSGGTLVLLFATGLLPAFQTWKGNMGDMDGAHAIEFAMLLGIVAGFVEQLVPSLLEEQSQRMGNGNSTKPQSVGAVSNSANSGGKKS